MLTLCTVLAALIGLSVLVYAVRHAQKGHEDVNGFHSEVKADAASESPASAKALRGKKAF